MSNASETQVIQNNTRSHYVTGLIVARDALLAAVAGRLIHKCIAVRNALLAAVAEVKHINGNGNGVASRTLIVTNKDCWGITPQHIINHVSRNYDIDIVWISGDKKDKIVFSVSTNQVNSLLNLFSFPFWNLETGTTVKKYIYFERFDKIY